ncbi:hypothetical protein BRADI_4g16494v3 [Brachypodium distachyon]|uniref:Uncharacterized protein n=1 Tax=Brachypodium distachyon TaxID=15368 RepID=A0A2K2CN66_BRADI|nr:hypothetical protein BRADI_4g16494v3 [Brachypodium distachyon]
MLSTSCLIVIMHEIYRKNDRRLLYMLWNVWEEKKQSQRDPPRGNATGGGGGLQGNGGHFTEFSGRSCTQDSVLLWVQDSC